MWPFRKWTYLGWTSLKWDSGTEDVVHFWGSGPDFRKRKVTGDGIYHLHPYYTKNIQAWLNDPDGDVCNVIYVPSDGLQNWVEAKFGMVWANNKWRPRTHAVDNVIKLRALDDRRT